MLGAESHVNLGADSREDALNCLDCRSCGGVRGHGRYRRPFLSRGGFVEIIRLIRVIRVIRERLIHIGFGALRRCGWRGSDTRDADLGQLSADAQEALAAPI